MNNSRRHPPESPRRRPRASGSRSSKGLLASPGNWGAGPPWTARILLGVLALAVVLLGSAAFLINRILSADNTTKISSGTPAELITQSIPTDLTTDVQSIRVLTSTIEATVASVQSTQAPVKDAEESIPSEFSLPMLRQLTMDLINKDRLAAGYQSLEVDAVAENAAQSHATDMADLGYLSHWNVDGFGPDWRYSRSGGRDTVQENIYGFSLRDRVGSADMPVDWAIIVGDAYQVLKNDQQYGQNILAPEHTDIGVGIAFNPVTGQARVVQEFISRLLSLEPIPTRVSSGERIVVKGRLLNGSTNPAVSIAFEPIPEPLSLSELDGRGYFISPANTIDTVPVFVNEKNEFVAELSLNGPPGLYHIRTTVDRSEQRVLLASDVIVELAR